MEGVKEPEEPSECDGEATPREKFIDTKGLLAGVRETYDVGDLLSCDIDTEGLKGARSEVIEGVTPPSVEMESAGMVNGVRGEDNCDGCVAIEGGQHIANKPERRSCMSEGDFIELSGYDAGSASIFEQGFDG